MNKASEYQIVRELVLQDKTVGSIRIKLLDFLLRSLLPSAQELGFLECKKLDFKKLLTSSALSEMGIEACENESSIDFRFEQIRITVQPLSIPYISISTGTGCRYRLDEFEEILRRMEDHWDCDSLENFLINAFQTIGEWIKNKEEMENEILTLKKLRMEQMQSIIEFIESELRGTSVLRYNIDFKEESFTALFAPCAKALSVTATYEDYEQTLAGLGATINELSGYWDNLTQLAKKKGISFDFSIHYSEYKWTKVPRPS